jgi:hypothetical protein
VKKFNVTFYVIKNIIEKYRKDNIEMFKEYLDIMGKKSIHYSPELCKKIKEEIKRR